MKFHNLNIKASKLLTSKQNLKIKSRRIYLLIKEHNQLCLILNRCNDFWKIILILIVSFYVLLIWFAVYVPMIYSNLGLIQRLLMHLLLTEVIVIFACITFVISNVSSEVNLYYFILISI